MTDKQIILTNLTKAYKELVKKVENRYNSMGITKNNPSSVFNPLNLTLSSLEKEYLKQLSSHVSK